MSMTTQVVPSSDIDIFADEVMENPYPHYKELRQMGPVVFLEKLDAFAVTRYADVRAALVNWQVFSSEAGGGKGPAFNSEMNDRLKGIIIGLDPPDHDTLRAVLHERLRLGSMREIAPQVKETATTIVAELVQRGSFDGATELANVLVPTAVSKLVGITDPGLLPKMVAGSVASFVTMGPMNARTQQSFPIFNELLGMLMGFGKEDLAPGSLGYRLFEAAERGEISPEMTTYVLLNYIAPGFDTTISAMGNTLHLLATHPQAWDALTSDPSLVPAAINEALRHDAPIQIWGRHAATDAEVGGQTIPSGAGVAVVLGSANRDERQYPDADTFDIRRTSRGHAAFGFGVHNCIGSQLARLELSSMLEALIDQGVRHIELNGTPKRLLNNTTRGFESLPLSVR